MATSTHHTTRTSAHVVDPAHGTLPRLNRDWALLNGDSRSLRLITDWAGRFPELAAVATPQDIVDHLDTLHRAADWASYDAVFRVLLGLAQGDGPEGQLAWLISGRVMLPKAVLLTKRLKRQGFDWEDTFSYVTSALFEIVRTYPLKNRPARIYVNIALDTRKLAEKLISSSSVEDHECEAMTEALTSYAPAVADDRPELAAELADLLARASHLQLLADDDEHLADAVGGDPRAELIDLLVWAVDTNAISLIEAQRIAAYYRSTKESVTTRAMGSEGARIRQCAFRAVKSLHRADLDAYFDVAA